MANEILIKVKDFNRPTIKTELEGLGLQEFKASFSGFEGARLDRLTPFPEPTRIITRRRQSDGSVVNDVASRGEVRVETRNPLTAGELSSLNGVLDSHDATIDDLSQSKDRQTIVDVADLRTTFDAGIADPTMAKVVRLVLNDNGEDV